MTSPANTGRSFTMHCRCSTREMGQTAETPVVSYQLADRDGMHVIPLVVTTHPSSKPIVDSEEQEKLKNVNVINITSKNSMQEFGYD